MPPLLLPMPPPILLLDELLPLEPLENVPLDLALFLFLFLVMSKRELFKAMLRPNLPACKLTMLSLFGLLRPVRLFCTSTVWTRSILAALCGRKLRPEIFRKSVLERLRSFKFSPACPDSVGREHMSISGLKANIAVKEFFESAKSLNEICSGDRDLVEVVWVELVHVLMDGWW